MAAREQCDQIALFHAMLCVYSCVVSQEPHKTVQAPAAAAAVPGGDPALIVAAAGSAQPLCQGPVRAPRPQILPGCDDATPEACRKTLSAQRR